MSNRECVSAMGKKGEMTGSFNVFFGDNALGLNHVTLKGRSVEGSTAFLKREGITSLMMRWVKV